MRTMLHWGIPILQQAAIIWVAVCAVVIPALVLYQRRRWGALHKKSLLFTPVILLYLVSVISFTFLPLPDPDTFQCNPGLYYPRYYAGWSVQYAFQNTQGLGVSRFFTWWFMQIYLNVLLFVPWGIIGRRVLKWNFRTVLFSAFGASLLIELTQLTGLWGIYHCRYRTFDVDDMITNTLGAIIGWALMEIFSRHRARGQGRQ